MGAILENILMWAIGLLFVGALFYSFIAILTSKVDEKDKKGTQSAS